MSRTVAVLFAVALAASVAHAQPVDPKPRANPDVAVAVEGNNQFAFDLYARLAQKPGNNFFSPYSISNALAMTYAGARGQTAREMAKTLHFTLPGDKLHPALGDLIRQVQGKDKDRPFQLSTVNRLWAQKGLPIRPEFLHITQTDYQSGLEQVDFIKDTEGSRTTINHWVEEQTNDKIKELLKRGIITRLTRLVLTNAIYFKADWVAPFNSRATRPADFTIPGTPPFKVPMMNQAMFCDYVATDDFQLVRLPYKGDEVSMVVILPKKTDGLAGVEKKLSAKLLEDLTKVKELRRARIAVMLPKFKMTEEYQLNNELIALGMPTAFNHDKADFSGITEASLREKLAITAVVHKAFVAVDEKGTEAAAATAVVIGTKSVPPPAIPFRADHPFLFVIQHNATGSILFMGRVHDPR